MAIRGKQGYIPKQRNSNRRKRKSVIVISAEGRNKTETLYLKNFKSAAIKNVKKLEQFNLEDGRKMHTAEFQPSTEVYKIVESIPKIEKRGD